MRLLDIYFFVNYYHSYKKVRSYRTVSAVADIALLLAAVSTLLVKLIVERFGLHFYQELKGIAMILFYIAFLIFCRIYFDKARLINIHRRYRGVDNGVVEGMYLVCKGSSCHFCAVAVGNEVIV